MIGIAGRTSGYPGGRGRPGLPEQWVGLGRWQSEQELDPLILQRAGKRPAAWRPAHLDLHWTRALLKEDDLR